MTSRRLLSPEERAQMAKRLRAMILRDFASVSEFCREAKLDRSAVQVWLGGGVSPSAYGLMRIGRAGLSLDELFGFAGAGE